MTDDRVESLDFETLRDVIVGVESGLNERDLEIEPESKAELIILLCKHFSEDGTLGDNIVGVEHSLDERDNETEVDLDLIAHALKGTNAELEQLSCLVKVILSRIEDREEVFSLLQEARDVYLSLRAPYSDSAFWLDRLIAFLQSSQTSSTESPKDK